MKKFIIRFIIGVVIITLIIVDTSFVGYSTETDLPTKKKPEVYKEIKEQRKGWDEYKNAIRHIETRGFSDKQSYYAKSPSGKHWGRYQLGRIARTVAGHPNITYMEFATNPQLQEEAFDIWIKELRREMKPYVRKYKGTTIDGVKLSESGIIAMAHNVGGPETRKYLDRGKDPPGPLKFLKLYGYDLDKKKPE